MGEHKSFILVEDISDHLPVMVCSNLSLPKSEKSTVTLIRDTKNFEVEKLLDKLTEGMELLGDIKEECIDNYTEKFIDIFHETLNIHVPLRKQSRKETKLKNKPWLSKGILISIQQKNLLYKRPLTLNDSNTWAQYKVYRNKLTHINRFKAGLFGHHRKLGGGQALPRCLNAYIFVNTRAKVSKKRSMCQEFYTLFCQSLIFQKNFTIIEKLLVFVTPLKISLFSEKREKRNKSGYASTGCD